MIETEGSTAQRNAQTVLFVVIALVFVAAFLAAIFSLVWWGTLASQRARERFQRVHAEREAIAPARVQRSTSCGPGQSLDDGVCGTLFPAPLAYVGAIVDGRYSACDASFANMMCGGWHGPPNQRALGYAALRYRRMALRALEQSGDPLYRSCMSARGTAGARRETTIEYKHVVETLLGDLHVASDLPALWGRLARAGYMDAAGAPFMLHKRQGTWYLSSPATLLTAAHELSESRLVQLLQGGPVAYGIVELQQRVQLIIETAQALYHHFGSTGPDAQLVALPFEELNPRWPWDLYLAGVTAPEPAELVVCDDLTYAQWVLTSPALGTLTVHNWRAWHEFHLAQAHQGHRAAHGLAMDECFNATLALAPELVNAALLSTAVSDPSDWRKAGADAVRLSGQLLPERPVALLMERVCDVAGSLSPDRYDHNVNLLRAWRWALEQTAPLQPANAVELGWPMVQAPILRTAYGEVSKLAIFGGALLYEVHGHNMTAAYERLQARAWEALPLTADRQHFLMVWAQAFCDTPNIDVDAVLRSTRAFSEVMACHAGQAMYTE